MVDHLRVASQPLPRGVKGRVVVHLGRKVVFSSQVLETVEVVPVTSSTPTGVLVDDLVQQ